MITDEKTISEMRKMRADGETLRSIAKKFGLSKSTVCSHTKGINPREERNKKIIRMYLDNVPCKQIAEKFRMERHSIWKLCNKYKVLRKKPRNPETAGICRMAPKPAVTSAPAKEPEPMKTDPVSPAPKHSKKFRIPKKHNGRFCRVCGRPLVHNWFYCPTHHAAISRSCETDAAGTITGGGIPCAMSL